MSTATDLTRQHYHRPEIKDIICKYALLQDGAWRALNGDFWYWYKHDGSEARLLNAKEDYDHVTEEFRTLYQTLNVFDSSLWMASRKKEEITSENPLGTPADTVAYALGVDIDKGKGCNIEDHDTKKAVESAAQFLIDHLKDNGVHNSVWPLFSGGGIYVLIHHGICKPNSTEGRTEFFEDLTDQYNRYIKYIEKEFFEVHPEHKGKVKYDALNNSKRVFKCILSIHRSKPYAVTPLNRDAIKIDFERARVPLQDDMIAEAREWYSSCDPAEREPLLKLLDRFKEEEKQSEHHFEEIYKSPIKTGIEDFAPCIKHIIDEEHPGEGKTRFSAILSTLLYQMGWTEEEAWELVEKVSDRNGLSGAWHVFESCYGRLSCPSCKTIQTDAAGYPHLGLKDLGVCKPDDKCDRWPGDYSIIKAMCDLTHDDFNPKMTREFANKIEAATGTHIYNAVDDPHPGDITEAELEAYTLPAGPKFECQLPKEHFIQRFMEYGSDISDAYKEYWFAGSIFALAVIADKKIKVVLRQGTIYPNLYISINGKSSLARKSTACDKTEAMLCQVLPALLSSLVPTEFSPEAFTEHLSEHNHAPWIRDEAAGVLSTMKRDYMRGFKDSLMQLYDCKPFYRKLRTSQRKNAKTEFRVDDPYLNVLFATTDTSLGANTEQNDTLSGFMARFLFFFPQGKKTKWLPLEEGTEANSIFEGIVKDQLTGISAKVGKLQECTAMHISSDAARYYTEWQRVREQEWTASNDGNAMQIYSRLAPAVIKLSMLFELGSPDFDVSRPIRLEFIQEACRLIDTYLMPTARAVYDLVGANAEKNVIDRIVAYLRKHNGKATRKEIMRDIKIKRDDFNDYLSTMLESGMVETKTVKRNGKGRDSVYVFLTSQDNVGNVSTVDNVAIVAKVEEIPLKNQDGKKSTLPTLDTKDILPIFPSSPEEPESIREQIQQAEERAQAKEEHDREQAEKHSKPAEISVLIRMRAPYKTDLLDADGKSVMADLNEGDELLFSYDRARYWVKRGICDVIALGLICDLEEAAV